MTPENELPSVDPWPDTASPDGAGSSDAQSDRRDGSPEADGAGDGTDEARFDRTIRVGLVDDRTVVREGLAALIGGQNDLMVTGHAARPQDLPRADSDPDVIVTEVEWADGSRGTAVVPALRDLFPRSAILVLTCVGTPSAVQSAFAAGADGYVLKTADSKELLYGIRQVARGDSYLQPSLGVELARWRNGQTADLTAKEEQVLLLLAAGHTNADIARWIGVSIRTVETHRSRLRQKLGLRTRAELVDYAVRSGLVGAG